MEQAIKLSCGININIIDITILIKQIVLHATLNIFYEFSKAKKDHFLLEAVFLYVLYKILLKSFLFDTCFLTTQFTYIVNFTSTYFTYAINSDAVDKR